MGSVTPQQTGGMGDSLSFAERNIAITGGGSGIGLAIVKTLLLLGANVYVVDLMETPPKEIADQERLHFTGKCDITKREACRKFLDTIPGRLDGLVSCAGVCPWEGKLPSDDLYRLNMEVNVTGVWNMGTEAIRRMSEQQDLEAPGAVPGATRSVGQGSIVNIGSGASLRGLQGLAAYTASKHAVLGLTRSWAKDFPRLRVNAVGPGVTDTPLARGAMGGTPEDRSAVKLTQALIESIPKGRMAYPSDIADSVVFLLSDWSSFITGQILPVNGGNF
ncbi:putative short chain alcohol dehydrogenase [Exophiala viscosa]|uniref:Short chain alcohol dehydrogenase n=1 Tax=Exophiala viscosa TaxID=2486360 RepID=A0AAN6DXR8_9EURO|nr:putative short chain alcohol dehydrogenase [Exophiala viscosa]KAI1619316.1 putative short chain alcohol dehydrogenase [Exophiala viscosa]